MSLKCEECGLVSWVGEASCSRCGAGLEANTSGAVYSDTAHKREPGLSKPSRLNPFFKALLYSIAIEFFVLVITGQAVIRSFFSHSAADPNSASNNPLATLGIIFHLPSFLITFPLGLILFAPLVQILLMAAIITLVLRWLRPITEG